MKRGELSVRQIAKLQSITPQWVNALYRSWKLTKKFPHPGKCGRKPRPVNIIVEELVLSAFSEYPINALELEDVIQRSYGIRVPHNTIHKILRSHNLAMRQPSKEKRRKWVRFERKHSNSLWHADWTTLGGSWFVAFQDDASRKIVGYGVFPSPTSLHSVEVLKRAINENGKPKAILTGRDIQFYASAAGGKERGGTAFQAYLKENGIGHILGRVNHPQTNGKIERFFGELKRKLHLFKSLDDFIWWYNNVRPHLSLKWDVLETPAQAFARKTPKRLKMQMEVVSRGVL